MNVRFAVNSVAYFMSTVDEAEGLVVWAGVLYQLYKTPDIVVEPEIKVL